MIGNSLRYVLRFSAFLLFVIPTIHARVAYGQVLGGASDFNLFSASGVKLSNSDVEGRLAAGGASTINGGYGIGKLWSTNSSTYDLIVNGALTTTGSVAVETGSAIYTSLSGNLLINNGGIKKAGSSPINFSSIQSSLVANSVSLGANSATGSISFNSGTLTLTGSSSGVNVFKFPNGFPGTVYFIRIRVPSGGSALINYGGTSPSLTAINTSYWNGSSYTQIPGVSNTNHAQRNFSSQIIWNFYQATSLTIYNMGFKGTILAPNAVFKAENGHIDGQVLVKNMRAKDGSSASNLQINWFPYEGDVPCPSPPAGANKSRCGTGAVTLTASSCTGTYKWYAALTGGSSLNTGSSFTTPSLTATKTYYVSCAATGCESSRDAAIATINPIPYVDAKATAPTCNPATSTANTNGKITLLDFSAGERFDYTTGSSYRGSDTYATATAIPSSGLIVSTLPNPATTQTYTVRVFNASGCYDDVTVSLSHVDCACNAPPATGNDRARCGTGAVTLTASGCTGTYKWYAALTGGSSLGTGSSFTTPALTATTTYYVSCADNGCESSRDAAKATINPLPVAAADVTQPTCNASGTAPVNNGVITLKRFITGQRYDYTIGSSYTGSDTYSTASVIPSNGVITSTLAAPVNNQNYTIRVFNSSNCFDDVTVTVTPPPCTPPPCTNAPTIQGTATCDANGDTYTVTFTTGGVAAVTASEGTVSGNRVTDIPVGVDVELTANPIDADCRPVTITIDSPPCTSSCSISVTVSPGPCSAVTGQYTVTGIISLTGAVAGTATISDGSATTTVTILASSTSVSFTLSGLQSDGATHQLGVSLPGCGSAADIYDAPANCKCPSGNCYTTTVQKN